jgi:hypothetical protein
VGCRVFGTAKVGGGELNIVGTLRESGDWRVHYIGSPPSGPLTAIQAVSCASGATACVAVGHYGPASPGGFRHPQSLVFSDGSWGPRLPADEQSPGVLTGVACTGADACQAVGGLAGATAPIERWNGTDWVLEHE